MSLPRFWVDFNEVYDKDFVWASVRPSLRRDPSLAFMLDDVSPGSPVELYDGEGVSCVALVGRVEPPIIHFKIDWSTWRSIDDSLSSRDNRPRHGAPHVGDAARVS